MDDDYYHQQRLSFDGHLCTIRYIGQVKETKGVWLGVEWDDPSRGRHSGAHGEVRYFNCMGFPVLGYLMYFHVKMPSLTMRTISQA